MLWSTHRTKSRRSPIAAVNLTPLIDVMLVLLVIFMVTAPMLTVGIKVNLPAANAPNIPGNDIPIVVFIRQDGHVFIGDIEVDQHTLGAKLKAITSESDSKIIVKADRDMSNDTVMSVMGNINSAGFHKVVLVTELPKKRNNDASASRK